MEGGSPHSSSKVPRSPAYVPVPADEAEKLSKDELLSKLKMMQSYVSYLEEKSGEPSGIEEKLKMHQQEASRRESVLLMRLAAKEHEMLDYLNQNQDLKQAKTPSLNQMQEMLLDPAVNLLFEKMKAELTDTKEKLEQAQNDLSAWKFTPDSVTGKKLMAKCRTLIQENQELGRQLSQGRIAQLEAELSLQKKYSEELKESQDELNDFVIQLDEEVEGMQSTICVLQQQLKEAKATIDKISEENRLVRERLQEIQPDSYVVPRSFTQENDLSRTVKSEADAYSGIVSPLIIDNGSVATRLSPHSLSNDGDAQNEARTVTECDGRLASLQDDSHPACGRSLRPVKPRHSPTKASQHLLAYKLEQASTPEMKPDFVLTSLASAAPSLAESEANIEAISSVSYDNYSCQAVLPSGACNKFEADSLSEHAQVFEPPSPTFPTTCSEQLRETRHRLVSPPSNEGSSRHVDNYSGCSDDVETRQSTETGPCEEQLGSQERRRIKAIICPQRASSSAKHSAFSISNLLKEESHLKLNASASESVDAQTHDHVQSAENASNGVIEDCAL